MNEISKRKPGTNVYRLCLIEVKSMATLALNHLGSVKEDHIPNDKEFREIFWSLLNKISGVGQEIDEMLENFDLPGVDDLDDPDLT